MNKMIGFLLTATILIIVALAFYPCYAPWLKQISFDWQKWTKLIITTAVGGLLSYLSYKVKFFNYDLLSVNDFYPLKYQKQPTLLGA